ncbi:helix-turn-helix transcriptional regulator [Nocardia transvalensis]|uniref:helix-turn-helix transcriptional regulator n=1 Tax=Nocardia transvalensis TaxID=37333 RepID=UPI00189398E6|nr:WYL domain-containing protein [Nocardia transvalensis]MBF6329867.1 WYL domain-containing protein [Nocardia transvalensis]
MRDPSGRLLQLLSLLQSPREWTGVELAERLGVTPRTIRRDIERLRELGYPVHATQGNVGGYRLVAGTAMPPLVLDDEEAVSIAIGLRAAATTAVAGIEDASVRALAKLEQVLPSRLRRRLTDLSQAAVLPPAADDSAVDPEVLAALAASCAAHEKVRFRYRKADGDTGGRFVEPHRLVAAGPRWYLIAFDGDRDDWRTFRVDRITDIHRTGVRVRPRELPDGVDAATWLMSSLRRREAGLVQARVLLHEPLESARDRVAARQGVLEAVDSDSCLLTTYPDRPPYVAYNIALLPMPYTVLGPPEVTELVRALGERAVAATSA